MHRLEVTHVTCPFCARGGGGGVAWCVGQAGPSTRRLNQAQIQSCCDCRCPVGVLNCHTRWTLTQGECPQSREWAPSNQLKGLTSKNWGFLEK